MLSAKMATASAMAAASGLSEEILERLAGDPMSCVERVARTSHIALSPASLGNLKAGVAQHFASHVNRYYPALHGILLGYRNPKLTAGTGSLLYDQPHVHVDVTADFYMFTPAKGSVLCGVVNKKNFDRIVGCLVHQTFNVALMGGVQSLTRAENKEGSRVKIEVTRVNYGRDSLPFIQGKLLADGDGEMVEYDSGIEVKSEAGTPTPVSEKRKREDDEEEDYEKNLEGREGLGNPGKKSKKRKHSDVKEEVVLEPKIKLEPELLEPVPKKKKKKDKEKEKTPDISEVKVKQEVNVAPDNPRKKKKKKDRGEKETTSDEVVIKQEPEVALPVEKKRKKKKA